jgi:drug/metabolite transporter (DMT)-like permease
MPAHPYAQIHLSVFLWGFTAILGKLISIGSMELVWYRMLMATIGFLMLKGMFAQLSTLTIRDILTFLVIGSLVCIHWLCFYGAIKIYNNASIPLACMGTSALFTALIEPFVMKKSFEKREFLIGAFSFLGIYFIYKANPSEGNAALSAKYYLAIGVGLCGSFLASFFTTLNKKIGHRYESAVMSVMEIGSGWLFLTALLLFSDPVVFTVIPTGMDFIYLIILSIFCTTYPFLMSLEALKKISAFMANLSVNLEPVYGFILAGIIFREHEQLNLYFYTGAFIIILSVMFPLLADTVKKKA